MPKKQRFFWLYLYNTEGDRVCIHVLTKTGFQSPKESLLATRTGGVLSETTHGRGFENCSLL